MSKRNIGKEIIQGLEEIKAWRRGELRLTTHAVEMPRAADVHAIRKGLGLSQPKFAGFMGVSLGTLRNWEQARREPHGPARALLLVASRQPAAVRAAFEAARPVSRTGGSRTRVSRDYIQNLRGKYKGKGLLAALEKTRVS